MTGQDTVLSDTSDGTYPDEELASNDTYVSGYRAPRPVAEQVEILRSHFPHLRAPGIDPAQIKIPGGAEGLFAVPATQALGPDYVSALKVMLKAVNESRGGVFYNNRGEQMDPARIRQRPEAVAAIERIWNDQGQPDIIVIPAQFGLRHRGRSVRRSRAMFARNEFGLDSIQLGAMVLTHPDRFQHDDDLKVDCPADEFDDPAADNRFGRTPCYNHDHEQLEFGTHWADRAYEINASGSGFFPA